VLAALNTSRIGTAKVGLSAVLAAGVLLYAASGHLIASRRPDNAIGWLLGSISLSLAVSMFAEQYAVYGLKTAPGAVPWPKPHGGVRDRHRHPDRRVCRPGPAGHPGDRDHVAGGGGRRDAGRGGPVRPAAVKGAAQGG